MSVSFTDRIREVQRRSGSMLCIGLDTDPAKLPPHLPKSPAGMMEFNRHIIEATEDCVCAYKINLAFYEAIGFEGWKVMKETRASIPGHIIVVGDAKRGDIGNTAEMYARSLFDDLGFDAATVNPYMGTDSVEPFLMREDRGAFILALTSNPGAKDFQYRQINGKPLYEVVIGKVNRWNTRRNCGLVVGATRPRELKRIRSLVRSMPVLIPGVGAQGGDMKAAVRYGCDRHGELAIINASRSILYASSGSNYAEAARSAAIRMRDEMNEYRREFFRASA